MVRLMRFEESPSTQLTIRESLDNALQRHRERIRELSLRIELDFEDSILDGVCPTTVPSMLESLLSSAIARSPAGSELAISVCRTARGIEIEIADEGLQHSLPRTSAFSVHRERTAGRQSQRNAAMTRAAYQAGSNFPVFYAQCPQGGLAATIVLAARVAVKSIAA